jgi:hypothetical protein
MNILLFVDRLPAEAGGVKTVVMTMAEELSKHHQVCMLVLDASPRSGHVKVEVRRHQTQLDRGPTRSRPLDAVVYRESAWVVAVSEPD